MSAWAMQFIVFEPCPNATTAGGATKQNAANAANAAASLKLSPVLSAINIACPCPPEGKPKREGAPLHFRQFVRVKAHEKIVRIGLSACDHSPTYLLWFNR